MAGLGGRPTPCEQGFRGPLKPCKAFPGLSGAIPMIMAQHPSKRNNEGRLVFIEEKRNSPRTRFSGNLVQLFQGHFVHHLPGQSDEGVGFGVEFDCGCRPCPRFRWNQIRGLRDDPIVEGILLKVRHHGSEPLVSCRQALGLNALVKPVPGIPMDGPRSKQG